MDTSLAKRLCELNNDFYTNQAASFSVTRQAPWNGWRRCLVEAGLLADVAPDPLLVLDVGCGNLRFESFLADVLSDSELHVDALDSCPDLIPADKDSNINFVQCDVMELLAAGQWGIEPSGVYDLSVAFGLMHHIPLPQWRIDFLQGLIAVTKPGGTVCVSFWRFMDNDDLAARACETHETALDKLGLRAQAAEFAAGDYLLGWNNTPGAYRYCHSFSDEEIDALISACTPPATHASRFRADGRTGNLNEYVVFGR